MNSYFINWKSYFSNDQKDNYNLKNTKTIKLFNTNDLNMQGDYQINYLNKYLGELVMMYYIWKNNLKSDYICISQYRKDFCNINFDRLKNGEIQVFMYWDDGIKFNPIDEAFVKTIDAEEFLKKKFIEYLDIQHVYDKSKVDLLKHDAKKTHKMACLVFCSNWKIFCELCEFVFGYIEYTLPDNKWKDINTLLKLRDEQYERFLKYYEEPPGWNLYKNETRYLVWIVERIFSYCLSSLYPIFAENIYIKYNLICKCNDVNQLQKFYMLNKKICTEYIYVLVDDNHYSKIYNDFYSQSWCSYIFPNLKILTENEYEILDKTNLIELNEREFIDIDDTYSICKMTKEEIKKYVKIHD